MKRLLICLLLIGGCGLFESENDEVFTGHWTCILTVCDTSQDGFCTTSNQAMYVHAASKHLAGSECLDNFPIYTPINPDSTDSICQCYEGYLDDSDIDFEYP